MRKILFSLATILMVASLATGATRAYFSDQNVVANNTLGAGKLDIDVRAEGTSVLPITVSNMQPGVWSGLYELGVYNQDTPVSTMSVKYRFYDGSATESVTGFYNLIRVRVRHTFAGTAGVWPIVWEGWLKDIYVDSPIYSITTPTGSLAINNTHVYKLEFKLDEGAGNAYQNASSTFSLIFDATQVNNPGW